MLNKLFPYETSVASQSSAITYEYVNKKKLQTIGFLYINSQIVTEK